MLSRRLFALSLPLFVSGCAGIGQFGADLSSGSAINSADAARYGAVEDGGFEVAPVDLRTIDPALLRQDVAYDGAEPFGTVVVDPGHHFLYLVQDDGRAIRYGVGVGREGFGWSGDATIARKAAWPTWTPPAEMVARDPHAAPWAGGMPGGPKNPLGARALYLFQNNVDTLYRIHGANDPRSIGKSMSSGCIRMLNQDIMDLYGRVPTGSRAVVLPATSGV